MNISIFLALFRSVRSKCPNCGIGHLYYKYLKLYKNCNNCSEELGCFRTDDFGPWLTIVIVGHIVVPLILYFEQEYAPALWLQASIWIPATLMLVLYFLPFSKGVCLAILWKTKDKN